jgi:hypothetical protein
MTCSRKWIKENILTSAEAAAYLGLTRQAVHIAMKQERLIPVKDGIYLKSDLDRYARDTVRGRPKMGVKRTKPRKQAEDKAKSDA